MLISIFIKEPSQVVKQKTYLRKFDCIKEVFFVLFMTILILFICLVSVLFNVPRLVMMTEFGVTLRHNPLFVKFYIMYQVCAFSRGAGQNKLTVAVLRYLIFYGFCIPRVAENQSFFSYY